MNVTALVLASGDYGNYAQVATSDQSDPDSTPGDDSVEQDDDDTATTTPIPVADLSIVKTVNNATANVGSECGVHVGGHQ